MRIDDLIRPLLERGREAHRARLEILFKPDEMPIGIDSINVVRRSDFELHPGICLDFVTPTCTLHVLDHDGTMKALLTSHRTMRPIKP